MPTPSRWPSRLLPASRTAAAVAVLAGAVGFMLNGFGLAVIGGIELVFGGLLSLPVALRLGPAWGGVTAAIAFSRTWIAWGHPMGLVCYTAEAVAAGWLTRRRGASPAAALLWYWLLVGLPAVAAYVLWYSSYPFPSYAIIILKYPINTLLIVAPVLALLRTGVLAQLLARGTVDAQPESLRQILFGRFGALSVIPVVALAVVSGGFLDGDLRQRSARQLVDDAAELSESLATYLQDHRLAVETLARQLALRQPEQAEVLGRSLEIVRMQHSGFRTLLLADRHGDIVALAAPPGMAPRQGRNNVGDRDYFVAATTTRRSYASGVFQGRTLGHDLIVALSAPVLDHRGEVAFVVEGSLDIEGLGDVRQRILRGGNRQLVIVDHRNQVVVASPALGLRPLGDFGRHALAQVATAADGTFTSDLWLPGAGRAERHLGATATVAGYGWRASIIEPIWNTQRAIALYYLAMMLCALGAVVLVLAIARRTAQRITDPLDRLVAATDALARQEPTSAEPPRHQAAVEITRISESLHDAAVTLSRSNAELVRAVDERDQTHAQLRQVLLNLDATVQTRTAELEQARRAAEGANEAKSEFLASMSHELRTPLNVILGMAQVLDECTIGPLNDRQRGAAQSINESGAHLLALINDILDLSKIEAGMLEIDIQTVDVRQVCEAGLRFVRQAAKKKQLELVSTYSGEVDYLQADPRRLRQILINLLHNAVKFTPAGGRIGLRVETHETPAAVTFTVWDTGVGIVPEHLPKLFRSFVQVDSSLTREHEGTGLGLALVDKLTRMHGGTVSVQSEPGVGSAFTVTLPVDGSRRAAAPIEPELPRPHGAVSVIPGNPLLLVADDDVTNLAVVEHILGSSGCRLVLARNGVEAVELAERHLPDLIVMDVQMPVMDGLEATRRIRANSATAAIPVLALTALAMPADRLQCLEAGATMYLSKPVDPASIRRAVTELLARRQPAPPAPAAVVRDTSR